MPFQSKRISLLALGMDGTVPGMAAGNHLRIGFDPRMGFPPCGFFLYRREHQTGPTRKLDFLRLFTEKIPAPFRHGYLQDGIAVFHPQDPLPVPGSGNNSIRLTDQILGVSFRSSPFVPDSEPKVVEVRVTIRCKDGEVTVEAFDDRYDNNGFSKILVAHERRKFSPADTEHTFHLRADLISLVEIQAPADSLLLSFDYTLLGERGWKPLAIAGEDPWGLKQVTRLLLPTAEELTSTDSTYPTCPETNFPRSASEIEKELPLTRLKHGFVAKVNDDDVHGEYDDIDKFFSVYLGPEPDRERFKGLREALKELQSVPPSAQIEHTVTHPGDADESTTFAPLPMILTGSVDYAFARLMGLAAIDMDQETLSSHDYMVEAQWEDDDVRYFWITHDVFQGRDKKLNQPDLPEATPVADVTRPGSVKTNVQLEWLAPKKVDMLARENQYVGYHVFRRGIDPGEPPVRLTQSEDELTGLRTPDLLLLGQVQGDEPAPPPAVETWHYLDRPPAYGTVQYGLQAQDLFGRRSEIHWTGDIKVPILVDPSPVSDLFAFYLDTEDPGQAELDAGAAAILNATGQASFSGTALLISFRYPEASIDAVDGDVQSFKISYRHGRLNGLLGTLATPSIVGPPPAQATAPVQADVEFTTTTPVPLNIDGFGGERLRGSLTSHGEHFAIVSATRLNTNRVRLRVRARRDYLPQVGEASLTMERGGPGVTPHPAFVSVRNPAAWSGFDLRHPAESTSQGPLTISGTSNTVLSPLPVGMNAGQIVVSRTIEPPANLGEGEPATPTDWVYRIVVKNVAIPLPNGLTQYPGAVTAQVFSSAGRQSELPAPAFVQRMAYGAPPPLTELASSEFIVATRPDFEGRIGVALTWPTMAGVQQFNVYRTEVPKLLQARNVGSQTGNDLFENEANRSQVKLLGGQLASIPSFTLATPVPITPEIDPENPSRNRWVDLVAAPREQNYVYRIQPVGPFGEAPWPPDSGVDNQNRDRCLLVLQKNRDLLLPPAIYELEPLDRSVGVVVRNPLSPSISGVRIYKTSDPSFVNDVRTMTLIHGTIPFTHQRIESLPATNGTPARLRFVDGKVQVGTEYFYRIIFVDEFGNFSLPSEPLAATPRSFAPPSPPVLSATRTGVDTVTLSWTASHNEGQVKPQRKRSGEGQWRDVTPDWLLPTDNAVDDAATGIVAHRLLLRDAKGRVVHSEVIITEA